MRAAATGYHTRMATIARRRGEGVGATTGAAVRSGLWGLARIVSLITAVVVGIIVIGIALVLLEANRGNDVVNAILNAGEFLVEPFDNVFKPDGHKAQVGVNWGLAAVVYFAISRLLARLAARF